MQDDPSDYGIPAVGKSQIAIRRSMDCAAGPGSMASFYCRVDHDLRLIYMGPAPFARLVQERQPPIGLKLWDAIPDVGRAGLAGAVRRALEMQEPFHLQGASLAETGSCREIFCWPCAEGLDFFFSGDTDRSAQEPVPPVPPRLLLQKMIDALPAPTVVLEDEGIIVAVNAAWRRFLEEHDFTTAQCGPGANYLAGSKTMIGAANFAGVASGLQAVLDHRRRKFEMAYRCKAGGSWLRLHMYADRCCVEGADWVVISHQDVTGRKAAQLAGRLLAAQDEERLRIARELHDSTAQNLFAALLDLDRVRELAAPRSPLISSAIDTVTGLIDRSIAEIRTLSYMLHPPLLEELGLATALRRLARGFERRSRIKVSLDLPETLERMPTTVESTLFRVVQEALTNIYRHSGSATAEIRWIETPIELALEVRDRGKKFPDSSDPTKAEELIERGTGLAVMEARLRQLGGQLELRSPGRGLLLTARLPRDAMQGLAMQ